MQRLRGDDLSIDELVEKLGAIGKGVRHWTLAVWWTSSAYLVQMGGPGLMSGVRGPGLRPIRVCILCDGVAGRLGRI